MGKKTRNSDFVETTFNEPAGNGAYDDSVLELPWAWELFDVLKPV